LTRLFLVTLWDEFMTSGLAKIFVKCRFNLEIWAGSRRHGRSYYTYITYMVIGPSTPGLNRRFPYLR
jgi:hypothetical protein